MISVLAHNMCICAIWADEYRLSTFVILINFSNLAVSKQKLRPSGLDGILFPQQHKCLVVVCHPVQHPANIETFMTLLTRPYAIFSILQGEEQH